MAPAGKRYSIALWPLSALLAVLYLVAGGMKLAGTEQHVQHFANWGYPDWFRLFIGGAEVLGACGLMVPRLAPFAVAGLAAIMGGAVYTHLSHGEGPQAVIPGLFIVLLVLIARLRRAAAPPTST